LLKIVLYVKLICINSKILLAQLYSNLDTCRQYWLYGFTCTIYTHSNPLLDDIMHLNIQDLLENMV